MVHVEKKHKAIFFVCDECGFGYKQRETAKMCEDYCKEHGVCSIGITKKAVLMLTYA